MHYVPSSLFSIDTNPKTIKGQKYGFMTAVLYLAPADQSGYQVCPMAAVAGCEAPCLNRAGRGAFTATQKARINKTRYFFEARAEFMAHIAADIAKLVRRARAADMVPLVRMNGTSDIKWENIPVTIDGTTYENIMAVFPDVQFYDYTKIPARHVSGIKNYDLTFSYSGLPGYQKHVARAIDAGMRVAVVFRNARDIPAQFLGLPVVPGDDSDIRHIDPASCIVALYAKGPARRDQSGFVVDIPARVIPIVAA
jgi:hypothetical protein